MPLRAVGCGVVGLLDELRNEPAFGAGEGAAGGVAEVPVGAAVPRLGCGAAVSGALGLVLGLVALDGCAVDVGEGPPSVAAVVDAPGGRRVVEVGQCGVLECGHAHDVVPPCAQ